MIKIICVGKIKEKFFTEALNEYIKRIRKYSKIEIIELNDESNGNILKKEGEAILKNLNNKDYIITLEIDGKEFDSKQFSKNLEQTFITNSNIVFIIGSSLGIAKEVKEKSNLAISFSKLTFPHQLFRVLLLEQIYRSFKIINNETYHK